MKKGILGVFALVLMAGALSAAPVFASEASVGNTSSTSMGMDLDKVLDQLYINYFAIAHGPELGNMSSSRPLGNNGLPTKFPGLYLDSTTVVAYKVTPTLGVGTYIPFLAVPVKGQGLVMGDFGFTAYEKETITSVEGLHLFTDLVVQLPTSGDSQSRGMHVGVKSMPAIRYDFPKSRFTVGAWTEEKVYEGVTKGKELKLYAEPYVAYLVSRTIALNMGYEMEADHYAHTQPRLQFSNYETDLQPGFVWFASPHFLVNPYVQIFTGNSVTMDTTAIGAVVSATL